MSLRSWLRGLRRVHRTGVRSDRAHVPAPEPLESRRLMNTGPAVAAVEVAETWE